MQGEDKAHKQSTGKPSGEIAPWRGSKRAEARREAWQATRQLRRANKRVLRSRPQGHARDNWPIQPLPCPAVGLDK